MQFEMLIHLSKLDFFARKQYVVYRNASSPIPSVGFGVPQGSMGDQILFIMFLNEVLGSSCATKFVFYADVTSL